MNKEGLKRYFKGGGSVKIINHQGHKFFNVVRKAEKNQSNAVMFSGGSWLYFNEIDPKNITEKGFKIGNRWFNGGFIEYVFTTEQCYKNK